jgi:hypothetical protein
LQERESFPQPHLEEYGGALEVWGPPLSQGRQLNYTAHAGISFWLIICLTKWIKWELTGIVHLEFPYKTLLSRGLANGAGCQGLIRRNWIQHLTEQRFKGGSAASLGNLTPCVAKREGFGSNCNPGTSSLGTGPGLPRKKGIGLSLHFKSIYSI